MTGMCLYCVNAHRPGREAVARSTFRFTFDQFRNSLTVAADYDDADFDVCTTGTFYGGHDDVIDAAIQVTSVLFIPPHTSVLSMIKRLAA
jgi:hypothetical protein